MSTIIFTLSIILAACWIITLLFFQWLKWREQRGGEDVHEVIDRGRKEG